MADRSARRLVTIFFFPTLVAILWVAGLVGCGPKGPVVGRVSGTITFDSQPLPGAMISFIPEQGKESNGYTDENGQYQLIYTRDIQGALVGTHTVVITTASEHQPKERLPEKYHVKSELRKEVKKRSNTIDFDLNSES